MFDISQFETADTSVLHLKGPDEELLHDDAKQPVTIELYGPGSEPFVTADTKRSDRMLTRSRKNIVLTAVMVRADHVDFLAAVTKSINNLRYSPAPDLTGEALAKALYADRRYGWVYEQVVAHLADFANFTRKSATN